MRITPRVRILNFFRNVFRVPALESWLVKRTVDKSPQALICKLVPNPYQYSPGTWRTIERHGITLTVDISDFIGHGLFYGFRDAGLERLFSLCSPDATVIDVGANFGWTLLNLSRRAPAGRVIGFEPDPLNFERCNANVVENGFPNTVVLPYGLGEKRQTAVIETRTVSNRGGNRVAPAPNTDGAPIVIITLDDFLSAEGIARVDLIKIDVEGYELKVLRGAENTLRRFRPLLFVEVNEKNLSEQGDSATTLLEYLMGLGYSRFSEAVDDAPVDRTFDFVGHHIDMIAR